MTSPSLTYRFEDAMSDTQTPTPKTCRCAAHSYAECICGAWDDLDPIRLRDQLAAARAALDQIKRRIFGDHY